MRFNRHDEIYRLRHTLNFSFFPVGEGVGARGAMGKGGGGGGGGVEVPSDRWSEIFRRSVRATVRAEAIN